MASVIYNSFLRDALTGAIDVDTDTIYVMLTTSTYAENHATHTKRSDVTNEVAATGGYVAGGFVTSAAVTVTIDTATTPDSVLITLPGISIGTATITARKAVYYKRRGGVATADELIAVNDFGSDVSSTGGPWAVASSTIRITLPAGQG